jgi:DNA-binding transcriptional ArsR family regulator
MEFMKQDTPPLPIEQAASAFAALGSEQRLHVLATLVRAGPEGLSIGALGERSGVRGSTLTHHLKILAQSGLIGQSRQGRTIICVGAAYDRVRGLSDYLLSQCCADRHAGDCAHGHDRDD